MSDDLASETIEGFLEGLASDEPTPGGGAVAALCGAAGASLISMVCRLTIGREAYADVEDRMRDYLAEADRARPALLNLAERDEEAFRRVMAAFKLPKEDDRQKAERSAEIQRAYEVAARVPLDVAERAAALLPGATAATQLGNANAASDGLSAAHALHAAVHSALANVEINAAGLKDETVASELRSASDRLRTRADDQLADAQRAFAARIA